MAKHLDIMKQLAMVREMIKKSGIQKSSATEARMFLAGAAQPNKGLTFKAPLAESVHLKNYF